MIECWMCGEITNLTEKDFGDHICKGCGVTISIYDPKNPDWKPENEPTTTEKEWLKKEEQSVDDKKSSREYRDKLHKRWQGLKGGFNSD